MYNYSAFLGVNVLFCLGRWAAKALVIPSPSSPRMYSFGVGAVYE